MVPHALHADAPLEAAQQLCDPASKADPEEQYATGWRYYNGREVAKDDEMAAACWIAAAAQGYADAQYIAGVAFDKAIGVNHSSAEAARWWLAAANQGIAKA